VNEDDFRHLVDRARDAEGEPATPPIGLVERARRAARRRTRLLAAAVGGLVVAVVVAVVVGGVAAPRLLESDDERVVDPASAGGGADEFAAHGGPCPEVLPDPVDDEAGHGFGTSTPATEEPRLEAPEAAWICQYVTRDVGRTASGGTAFEWSRSAGPRRIDDAALPNVAAAMESVGVDLEAELKLCTADLGPRYVLVGDVGGDLSGVVVDDFGCRDVRLTDDPFVTAPGDPQDGSTVAGVLTGPDDLVDTLESWWNTSPATDQIPAGPDPLVVTCTDGGPRVAVTTVTAGPAGVEVVVEDQMSTPGSYLTYTSAGPNGGDAMAEMERPATYAFPPVRLTLGCASPPGMDDTGSVVIELQDPDEYWRPSTLDDHGCAPGGAGPSWAVSAGSGDTPEAAVDDLLVNFAGATEIDVANLTAEPAPSGYVGSDIQTWVGLRRGSPYVSILVTDLGTSYSAYPDSFC
jgi:hypothetical protein